MRCPKDDTDLIEIERQGIDIDYCPTCKGVWLDRSELDQLLSSAATAVSADDDLFEDDGDSDIDRSRRRAETNGEWEDARPRKDKKKSYRRELTRGAVDF